MILFDGRLLPDQKLNTVIDNLQDFCIRTIESQEIRTSEVIEACSILSERICEGTYDHVFKPLLTQGIITQKQFDEAMVLFRRENLEYKYDIEIRTLPESDNALHTRHYMPLGILFHIAAGNAEGLPFYSVIEGLLVGNINILKPPSHDNGLSAFFLQELVKINPKLAPYITVLDIPSSNIELLRKVGKIADAIVIWGGSDAIRSVRTMVDPETRIISWGHKLSFAYAVPEPSEEELRSLAIHMCETNQLLCSSCQGIFIDTDDQKTVEKIGTDFLSLLEEESLNYPSLPLGIRGKISISLYNEELEAEHSKRKVLRGKGVSVILSDEHTLNVSYMFRNCWIKPLPRTKIIKALKPYRDTLQTAGLLCPEIDRPVLETLLFKAGVTRITRADNMSSIIPGSAHDGEYPLRRYCRIVETHF